MGEAFRRRDSAGVDNGVPGRDDGCREASHEFRPWRSGEPGRRRQKLSERFERTRSGASVDSAPSVPGGRGAAARTPPSRGIGTGFLMGAQPIMVLASDGVLHFLSPITAKELL